MYQKIHTIPVECDFTEQVRFSKTSAALAYYDLYVPYWWKPELKGKK